TYCQINIIIIFPTRRSSDLVIEISELQALQEKVNNYITENKLSEVLDTKLTDEGLLVTIKNDISFDSGSDRVNKKGKQIAEEIRSEEHTSELQSRIDLVCRL